MGASKYCSHLYFWESNSSQKATGVTPLRTASRTRWKAPINSSGLLNCDRLNSMNGTFEPRMDSTTTLTANDFPAPGGPKTPMDNGFFWTFTLSEALDR